MSFSDLMDILYNFKFGDVLDILIISCVFYWILLFIKQTRAEQLLKGLVVLFGVLFLSDLFGLRTTYYLLSKSLTIGFMALIVVFQPELRKGLERLGRSGLIKKHIFGSAEEESGQTEVLNELGDALNFLSRNKIGALILVEHETGLNDFIETGIRVDAEITSALLVNVFFPNSPLHDGAAIIRDGRLHSAACFLPLSDNRNIAKELGTRHRAAIGATEQSDAIAIIVSEETGAISMAQEGRISRFLDTDTVKERLQSVMSQEKKSALSISQILSKRRENK